MSRKKKPSKASAAPPVANKTVLPDQAEVALGASRYREAIEHYKDLLKQERRPAWLEGLAAAYAGRAEQLAQKGMINEALALWRTRADMCGTALIGGPYVGWLLKAGQGEQVLRLLAGATQKLSPGAQAQLETQAAAAVLVAPDSALTGLAADSPLLRHRAAARAALAAFARGDDTAMAEHVQAIPFRSPYRDLRALLKAFSLYRNDARQAAIALARVPTDGPFEPLAAVLRVCVLPGEAWLASLHSLNEEGRALVLDMKGWPEDRRPLVLDLARLSDGPASATMLYDLLVRHRSRLPADTAGQLCRRLLPHAPERLKTYPASFGALCAAEKDHILAQAAELKRDPERAEDHWLSLVERLRADPAQRARAALVLRRLADARSRYDLGGPPDEDAVAWLAQSLELDPEDRATHVTLIRALRVRSEPKELRKCLEAALARFPDDAEVLLEAVESALASGAFKKAATLAKRVLELDPINPRVRTVIGHAHLSHARKQIAGRNPVSARRELDEAAQWLRTKADHGSIKLLRGIIDERGEEGDALLREGLAEMGCALVGSFHLVLEASYTGHDPKALLRRAGIERNVVSKASEVVALAHALNAARVGDKAVQTALDLLGESLRGAPADQFAEAELLVVCEALHRHNRRALVRRYADAALRRWPARPVFVYLRASAAYGANPWRMPQREVLALDRALELAQASGDQRTALRLNDLLAAATGYTGLPDEDEDDYLGGLPGDDVGTMLEMMLAALGEDAFLAMVRKQLGKSAFEEMRRDFGGNKKQFIRALIELLAAVGPPPGLGDAGAYADPLPVVPLKPPRRRKRHTAPPDDMQKDLFDD
jgi:tetratricopeptide (TPR) repeat protein